MLLAYYLKSPYDGPWPATTGFLQAISEAQREILLKRLIMNILYISCVGIAIHPNTLVQQVKSADLYLTLFAF